MLQAPRRLLRSPLLRLARRNVVVGRDGRHFNSILLMVPQAEEWQIERFGRFSRTASPGLNFAIPFVESIAYKRSLKETTIPIHPQTAVMEVRLGHGQARGIEARVSRCMSTC